MLKKIFLSLFLLFLLPVLAGEYENALAQKKKMLLYFYTPQCGYCSRFAPRYAKLEKMYNQKLNFVKINANTLDGYTIFRKYNGSYVPYVLLINPVKNVVKSVQAECLMDKVCIEKEIERF